MRPMRLFTFHAESYAAFFDALIGERMFARAARAHPRLKILGLLEARLIGVDRLVMAGLDETVWPPRGESDCFLNRAMRAHLELSSPERRIGQTAHDFVQGFGAPEVVAEPREKARRRADHAVAFSAAHGGAGRARRFCGICAHAARTGSIWRASSIRRRRRTPLQRPAPRPRWPCARKNSR